jgi:hypothetical protein
MSLSACALPINVTDSPERPLVPCDVVRTGGELAFYLGIAQNVCFFETEVMVANDLGAGSLDLRPGFQVVCEIGENPRSQAKFRTKSGDELVLNVNLPDFRSFPLLPLDVLVVNDRIGEICGFSGNDLWIRYQGLTYLEKFDVNCDFDLVYRRARVPTSKEFVLEQGSTVTGWIDLEHFRGRRCLPYDLVDYQGKKMIVQAVVSENRFIVADWETLEHRVFRVPTGKSLRVKRSLI